MVATVGQVHSLVAQRLGYTVASWPVELSIVDLCNEAGDFMCAQREWKWLERPPLQLDLIASQEYINLPADTVQVKSVEPYTASDGMWAKETTMAEVLARRRSTTAGSRYWYSVVYSTATVTGLPHTPRLEIAPIPTENVTAAFLLLYRAGWLAVASSTDRILVPRFLYRAFVEIVIGHAKASLKDAEGNLMEHLAPALQYLALAAQNDGTIQESYGAWIGGAGHSVAFDDEFSWDEHERGDVTVES